MREPTLAKGVPRAKQRPTGTATGNTNPPTTPCPITKKRTRVLTPGDTRINSPMAALRKDELIRQLTEAQQENAALTEQLRETNEQLRETRDQLKETREQVRVIQNNLEETTKCATNMSGNPNLIAVQHNNQLMNQPTAENTGEQPIETTNTTNPDQAGTPPLTYCTWVDVIRGATPAKRRLLREAIPTPKQDLTTIVITQWMETLTLPILLNDEMIEHAHMTQAKKNPCTKKSPRAQLLLNEETQISP
ncbi:hypothetical protein IWQ61_007086, partial [Dispira simplex]